MSIFSDTVQKEEKKRLKKIKMLLLIIASIFFIFSFLAWFWITQPVFVNKPMNSKNLIDPTKLNSHVKMLSETFFPRDESHPENLDKVANYIKEEFEKAQAKTIEQPYKVAGKNYKNIIAYFGPDTKERIVIGAHYDSAEELPAADDNASGVAGLIELAYLLGKTELPLKVELVAYTLEEPPYFETNFMGSAIHANSLKEQGVNVRLMVSLEMIGYFSDKPNSQEFPLSLLNLFYPNKGNFISIVGDLENGLTVRKVKKIMQTATPLPVVSINAPRNIPGIDFSDHLNYWNLGYNAIMISDTAFYRNKNYHTAYDTPEKLDYQRMAMVIEDLYQAITQLSQ
jgi:Zn-dependent M28 family amino/carboxypeptidase